MPLGRVLVELAHLWDYMLRIEVRARQVLKDGGGRRRQQVLAWYEPLLAVSIIEPMRYVASDFPARELLRGPV